MIFERQFAIVFHESTCSDAHVAIETRRDGDEKERKYVGAREARSDVGGNGLEEERERKRENSKRDDEARPYFRVTVALPSVPGIVYVPLGAFYSHGRARPMCVCVCV